MKIKNRFTGELLLEIADLREAKLPAPTVILLANWGKVSDKLCLELMRYDCENCEDGGKRFEEWARGGRCPYEKGRFDRCANFAERKELWSPGPAKSVLGLAQMLRKEK